MAARHQPPPRGKEICPHCAGSGWELYSGPGETGSGENLIEGECHLCGGAGYIIKREEVKNDGEPRVA